MTLFSEEQPQQPRVSEQQDQDVVSPVTTEGEDAEVEAMEIEGSSSSSMLNKTPRGTRETDRPVDSTILWQTEIETRRDRNGSVEPESSKQQNTSVSFPHKIKMDDDSLGLRSASGLPEEQHCQRQEPEGSLPTHTVSGSRRFSDDFQNKLLNDDREEPDDDISAREGVTPTTNGDTPQSSPPTALKEISISRDLNEANEGLDEEDENDITTDQEDSSEPPLATNPLMPPPPAPLKAPQGEGGKQPESNDYFLNSSMEVPSPRESSFRPPSSTDYVPPESDVSVFSIHSGYAMPDSNGLPPRIVPGTMVQSAALQHPYPAHISARMHHIPQQGIPPQHSLGSSNGYHPQHYHTHYGAAPVPPPVIVGPPSVGKRKVHFRLLEDVPLPTRKRASFLSFRRPSRRNLLTASPVAEEPPTEMDRGRVTVSWYEGTTTLELMEHVRTAVMRKLGLQGSTKLADLRILDEGSDPPEEIVLTPYIPSGSRLLLRFTTRDAAGDMTPPFSQHSSYGGAPESPSAAPSPHLSKVDLDGLGLNANQLALLDARLKSLQVPSADGMDSNGSSARVSKGSTPSKKAVKLLQHRKSDFANRQDRDESPNGDNDDGKDDQSSVFEMQSLHPEDQIQKSLQNITDLLSMERQRARNYPKQEKRQVIFIIANYFVLFISLIAISAEIQARAPGWNAAIERQLNSVKRCSMDQDALFECVSNGDFSGLVASVVLWISRSAATKRIFLFGFDSPRKLWTVVYESLVTAVCWGFSYMFIRRGMNPDTNRNFLQKYWKDAMYGSLAGFNAAFMKHVLKNLVPQEAIEDALHDRQLKILSWLPSFA